MPPDQERYAEALAIERIHGPDASAWVAKRMAALAAAGDQGGVDRFRDIAARLQALAMAKST